MEKKIYRRLSCSAKALPEVIASAYNDFASYIEVISVPSENHMEEERFTIIIYCDE